MNLFLALIIISTYTMVISKRISALINGFMFQSFFLFLLTLFIAAGTNSGELYFVAALILLLKVSLIPYFLSWIVKKLKIEENAGLFINPLLSLIAALSLSYLAYMFATGLMGMYNKPAMISFTISLSVILIGLFIMVFRMKAITQVLGLLVIENGLFLAAVALCGNMPFFVEIAIFFDIFVCVIILGIFVYKINTLFTHIDVGKLTKLKG
ncbi:MAG: hypothetical protein LHV68_04630 [Elusimicrobia bacterium]|nr:hypothetical protein [Candidatus Liberimonas magnetica]